MKKSVCLLVLITSVFGLENATVVDPPLVYVNTSNGPIGGTTNVTINKKYIYYKFSGIPYAKSPVGNLRFKPPVASEPWSPNQPLLATKEGSRCIQMSNNEVVGSEDCLFLNVYTRSTKPVKPSAVMVWIHGGGFNTLSGNYESFGPDELLENNVTVVTLNYRLGAFGFLSTEDTASPGNYALKDVLLALQWIKKNIRHFGGSPQNITLFGNSAGAAIISYLVQSPKSKGLIDRAIMQSATSLCLWALSRNAQNVTKLLANQLDISQDIQNNTSDLINQLREIDAESIVSAQETVKVQVELQNFLAGLPFGPVIEPIDSTAIVTESSFKLLSQGRFNKIPVIIGFDSNEMGNFFPEGILPIVLQELDNNLENMAPYDLTNDLVKRTNASNVIRTNYFNSSALTLQLENGIKFGSMDQFIRPIRQTVELMSKHTDVFFYVFGHVGNAGHPLENRNYWGVSHGEELNYLFNPQYPKTNFDINVSQSLQLYWTNFAKYGSDFNDFQKDLTKWRYSQNRENKSDTNVYYLKMGQWSMTDEEKSFVMEQNVNQTDWEFYQDIYKTYGDGNYDTY